MKKTFTINGRCVEAALLGRGHTTVLFFHGFGSSAAALPADERLLTANDLQILCVNRPGVGGSALLKHYTVDTVTADAKAVLEQLHIGQCVVAGWSAGGLFAQAFAQTYPGTVLSLHLISSALPFAKKDVGNALPGRWKSVRFINRYFPFLAKTGFRSVSTKAQKFPDGLMQQSLKEMVAADREVASDKRYYTLLLQAAVEGFAHEGKAVFAEANALSAAMIDYSRITGPVHIWTGKQDNIWPVATAQYLQDRLPQSQLHLFRHSGHLLYLREWEKIVTAFALQTA